MNTMTASELERHLYITNDPARALFLRLEGEAMEAAAEKCGEAVSYIDDALCSLDTVEDDEYEAAGEAIESARTALKNAARALELE